MTIPDGLTLERAWRVGDRADRFARGISATTLLGVSSSYDLASGAGNLTIAPQIIISGTAGTGFDLTVPDPGPTPIEVVFVIEPVTLGGVVRIVDHETTVLVASIVSDHVYRFGWSGTAWTIRGNYRRAIGAVTWQPGDIADGTPNTFAGWDGSGNAAEIATPASPEAEPRTFAGTITADVAAVNYATFNQSGAQSFTKGTSTFDGSEHVLPFNSDGSALTWNAGFRAASGSLPTSLAAALWDIVFYYHEARDELLVAITQVTAASVSAATHTGFSGTTVQAQLQEAAPKASPVFTGVMKLAGAKGTAAAKSSGAGYTVAATDSGQLHVLTAAQTVTLPAVATLAPDSGDFFSLDFFNDSGSNCTLDGPGATNVTLAASEIATVYARNGGKMIVAKGAATVVS